MSSSVKAMGMLLQDPSLEDLHDDWDFPLDRDFLEGMGSSKLMVRDGNLRDLLLHRGLEWQDPKVDLSFAAMNAKGGFLDNPQFHQVNAFAVAGHTLEFVEEALGREMVWKHGGPLVIRPHAFNEANAFYDPTSPSINFGSFTSPFRRAPVWTCLSHDVVAHELGHAILDSFRPLFLYSREVDVGAIHESVGDLLAMFSALEHKPVVEQLYRDSGGDMNKPSLVSGLAEEFGVGFQGVGFPYLRSALNGPPYGFSPEGPHERSTIWTAAIYQILSTLVQQAVPPSAKDVLGKAPARSRSRSSSSQEFERYYDQPANREGFDEFFEAIVAASKRVKGMLIRAFHYMPTTGITMPTLARLMVAADARSFPNDPGPREVAKKVFQERRLWDDALNLDPPGIGSAFEEAAASGPIALARAVAAHADALRIPIGLAPRLLTPSVATVVRTVDAGREGRGRGSATTITERYLYYAYELLTPAKMMVEEAGQMVLVEGMASVFLGGTLVMDENWKSVLLATDPDYRAAPGNADGPALQAVGAASERFHRLHRRGLQAYHDGLVRGDGRLPDGRMALPFVVTPQSSGGFRLVRRSCNLGEHLKGVTGGLTAFPFATDEFDLASGRAE